MLENILLFLYGSELAFALRPNDMAIVPLLLAYLVVCALGVSPLLVIDRPIRKPLSERILLAFLCTALGGIALYAVMSYFEMGKQRADDFRAALAAQDARILVGPRGMARIEAGFSLPDTISSPSDTTPPLFGIRVDRPTSPPRLSVLFYLERAQGIEASLEREGLARPLLGIP